MLPRRALMNDKIVSAQGENLSLVNVKGSKLNALSVYGKSMQSGTPTPENPVPIVSAGNWNEETQKWEYGVKLTGAQLFDISKVITEEGIVINNGDGTLTVKIAVDSNGVAAKSPNRLRDYCPDIVSGKTYYLYADSTGSEKFIYFDKSKFIWDFGSSRIITDDDLDSVVFFYASGISTEATVSNIMITEVSNAPYEPYKTPQTLTAQTPGGLPGIPVSSGGNYTDSDGQQWICDEIDFKNKKFIKRVERVSFDGAEDERWVRNVTGENYQRFYVAFLNGNKNFMQCLCNRFIYASSAEIGTCFVANSTFYIYVEASIDTVALLRDYLNTHPLDVIYPLGMPVEIDISDEEIQAFKELHTYSPTTTVSNDAGAWMKVGYREYRR